jgi:pimeloyl-ACP methyl ester carboxylesterase
MNSARFLGLWTAFFWLGFPSALTAQRKAGELKLEPYPFDGGRGEKVDAEMGRLTVPESRTKPSGRLVELRFVRFKSTATAPGSPVVYLAGGPGGSGIATARGSRFPLFMVMREVGDVIALDQRGTGLSEPRLVCPETLDYPLDRPGNREEMLHLMTGKARSCAESFRSQGVDLSAYNTSESADDLESLRAALGAPKISLWSISYGTHLALAALRRHEKGIDRVILAGVEGPDHTAKLPGNIQKALEAVNELMKKDPAVTSKILDLIDLIRQLGARLDRDPVTVETTEPRSREKVKVTLGRFDLELVLAQLLGDSGAMLAYPAVAYRMSQGDFSFLAQRVLQLRRYPLGLMMSYTMDCASGASPERMARILLEEKQTLLGRLIDLPFPEICQAWGVPDLGAAFRSPVKSRVPTLFISGTLDARTPVSNAEEVRQGFSESAHLIIEGAAHSDDLFLSSPQIQQVMLEFMKGQNLSTTRITLPAPKFSTIP